MQQDNCGIGLSSICTRVTFQLASHSEHTNVYGYNLKERSIHSNTCSQGFSSSEEGSSSLSHLAGLHFDSTRSEQVKLQVDNTDKASSKQNKQARPQKTLLDLVTPDTCKCEESILSHQTEVMRKKDKATSLVELVQSADKQRKPPLSDLIKPQSSSVSLQPLNLAQIIQLEQETAQSTSSVSVSDHVSTAIKDVHLSNPMYDSEPVTISDTCDTHNLSKGLQFSPLGRESKGLYLSDLTKLSSKTATSSRFTDTGQKNKTLSDLVQHQQTASKYPSLSQVMSVHAVISVEGSPAASPTCTLDTFKSGITFQYGCGSVTRSMNRRSSFFAQMMSHTVENNLSHSLSKFRQHVHGKLTKYYTRKLFQKFDFSSQSPDDVVQEKQCNVFS